MGVKVEIPYECEGNQMRACRAPEEKYGTSIIGRKYVKRLYWVTIYGQYLILLSGERALWGERAYLGDLSPHNERWGAGVETHFQEIS